MTGDPAVTGLGFKFGDADLCRFDLSNDLGLNGCAFNHRFAELDFIAVKNQQHGFKTDFVFCLTVNLIDDQSLAGSNQILFTANFDNRRLHKGYYRPNWENLQTLETNPKLTIVANRELPPADTSGKVIPVTGIKPKFIATVTPT